MGNSIIDYLNKIKNQIDILQQRQQEYSDKNILIAYRGESQDYGKTKLMPSLFRKSEYVMKEKYLFELLSDYNMVEDNLCSNIDKAIETQHYVAISRMLDITFSVLVAIYFACNNAEKDGYVYIFGFPEHYSPHSGYIEEFYSNILLNTNNNVAYARNFKVFSHSYSNDRIKAQKGGFIFFPGDEFCPINNIYYDVVKIKGKDKNNILEELDIMFRINKATIFPEKENIAKVIKEKFERENYISKRVSIPEEIETYFSRINYEMNMKKKTLYTEEKKDLLRILRKEENDILYYIKSQEELNNNDKEILIQEAKENFDVLSMMF